MSSTDKTQKVNPRISVLIPTWNRAHYLGEAIESILRQTFQNFEIIVIDDGSTDDTSDLVKCYRRVRYFRQPHSGIPAARNRALEEAKGELIAWLDSDDLYEPTKLEKQVQYLESNPMCQIIFCLPLNFSEIEYEKMTHRQQTIMDKHKESFTYCLPSACMRRDLFRQYGDFDLNYPRAEDTEWIARICAAGVDLGHCLYEELYLRRVHPNQISNSYAEMGKAQYLKIYTDAIHKARRKGTDRCKTTAK